jgi:hypothetical protein
MNTKSLINRTILTFAALAVAGVSVAVGARFVPNALEQTILVAVGSAIFGAGLTFFLVRFFALIERA